MINLDSVADGLQGGLGNILQALGLKELRSQVMAASRETAGVVSVPSQERDLFQETVSQPIQQEINALMQSTRSIDTVLEHAVRQIVPSIPTTVRMQPN